MIQLRWLTVLFSGAVVFACKTVPAPSSATAEPKEEAAVLPSPSSAVPAEPVNLLENTSFDNGVSAPWMPVILSPARAKTEVRDGAFCVDIEDRGANDWDIQLVYRGLTFEDGHRYEVSAELRSTAGTSARARAGMAVHPYSEYWGKGIMLGPEPKRIAGSFTKRRGTDENAELAFHFGGSLARQNNLPLTVCIDNVTLTDPLYVPPPRAPSPPGPSILVNQEGYLPGFKKTATVRSKEKSPLNWSLLKDGRVIKKGVTTVFGDDAASFEHLHIIDFSEVNDEGAGFVLAIGDEQSHPFAVSADIYKQMRTDALRFFYHHRSGVPIEMPYAGEDRWARPAGHVRDAKVPCLAGIGCSYTLDVKGGWYDAGDHGKYVVNAGYSVWALLNAYERAVHLTGTPDAFGDGTLNIPESKNGLSDLLDEVRFEIEFMLKMQVPEGEPLSGMVHHKIHDDVWTPIPTAPDKDKAKRFLHAPSTAATLNLSATAAQAARVWEKIDPPFAKKCLAAAKRAYRAAKAHPDMFIGPEDNQGGGAYEDNRVGDEFYWAAAELFITAGEKRYLEDLEKSPYFATIPTLDDAAGVGVLRAAMSWQSVEALGTISLLTVPNKLRGSAKDKLVAKIKAAADLDVEVIAEEGYRIALTSSPVPDYYWGSNFAAMNNLMVLAAAYDLTKDKVYRNAVAEGMDYLLGRNPLDRSFVTGYGDRPVEHPHHRFFAAQASSDFPPPPPGFIAGGPNQHRQDPKIQACIPKNAAPMICFADHFESYSTNEVAINWNASLAWLTAFLADIARSTSTE